MTNIAPAIIVCHANCIDGAGAAWAVAKGLGVEKPTSSAKDSFLFVRYEHEQPARAEKQILEALKGKQYGGTTPVYFADVTPEIDFMDKILELTSGGIHVFDHHASSREMLKDFMRTSCVNIHIDTAAHSASSMVWNHFFPNKEPPDVIKIISMMNDSDNGLQTVDEFAAAAAFVDLGDIGSTERALRTLAGLATMDFKKMALYGKWIGEEQALRLEKLLQNAETVQMTIKPKGASERVLMVNDDMRLLPRDASIRLVEEANKRGSDVAIVFSVRENGIVSMSIRTGGNTDASLVAAHLRETMGATGGATGGGHQNAAAVHLPYSTFAAHFANRIQQKQPELHSSISPPAQSSHASRSHPE